MVDGGTQHFIKTDISLHRQVIDAIAKAVVYFHTKKKLVIASYSSQSSAAIAAGAMT